MIAQLWWLFPLGLLVGAFGTLIGAGGGFILVPILLLLYPNETPDHVASISLAVVFFNALSGSLAYARLKRIDYKSGIIFSLATVPGAILGALTTPYLPRRIFDLVFGILMIVAGTYLWVSHKEQPGAESSRLDDHHSENAGARLVDRKLTDAEGITHYYRFDLWTGVLLSIFIGFISSLLGVGGGFIHVPVLHRLLNFPVHVATATSHFVLAIMALTGTLVHITQGAFVHGIRRTAVLGVAVLIGAQVGARMSNRAGGKLIMRGLALALVFVGLRLIFAEL